MIKGNRYRGSTVEGLKEAFDDRLYRVEPDVFGKLVDEWNGWLKCPRPERRYTNRSSFTVHYNGNYCLVRFEKALLAGEGENKEFIGKKSKNIAVYRGCIAPNDTIYKKKGMNR